MTLDRSCPKFLILGRSWSVIKWGKLWWNMTACVNFRSIFLQNFQYHPLQYHTSSERALFTLFNGTSFNTRGPIIKKLRASNQSLCFCRRNVTRGPEGSAYARRRNATMVLIGLNKWVLRLLLNESGEMQFLITMGRLFHKVGPAWAKARSPQVFVDFGTTRGAANEFVLNEGPVVRGLLGKCRWPRAKWRMTQTAYWVYS